MNIARVAAAALAMASVEGATAQTPTPAALASDPKVAAKLRVAEAWLETQLAHDNVSGAAVAVVHDQQLLWSRGFGHANVARKVPVTPQTRFSICSISKLFTSIATMRERDAGRLPLDRPIRDILPWFTIRDAAGADTPVTPRGLLTHSAGVPREADTPYWSDIRFPDRATVKARVAQQQMLSRPSDWFQYSNLGMTLLGEAVQATSGEPYADYVQRHILTPLGMSRTTTELPNELHGGEFAVGYTARRLGWQRRAIAPYTVNAIAPAAGFASTAEDLARFASWQFRLLAGSATEVLRASTLREMQRVHWVSPDDPSQFWGLGFIVDRAGEQWAVGHDGYCPGYRSTLMAMPRDKVAVVLLSNSDDVDAGHLGSEILKLVGPDIVKAAKSVADRKPAAPATAPSAPAVDLARFEGRYVRDRAAGDLYIAPYGDELMSVNLFSPEPTQSLTRLKPLGPDRFVRLRKDDSPADERHFERRADGSLLYWVHSNYMVRVPPAPGRR